jgi:hypothetical protein
MLRLQFITVLLVLLPLLAAASNALPTEKPADVKNSAEISANGLLDGFFSRDLTLPHPGIEGFEARCHVYVYALQRLS